MRKYGVSILILVTVLLVSGQQSCERGGGTDVGEGPYVGGNDGLSIAFLDDAPPLSNFQGDKIPIEVELTNNGEQEIQTGAAVVQLLGAIKGGSFDLSKKSTSSNTGLIDKVRDSSDVPDFDFVDLGTAKLNDASGIGWSPLVRAQVCYAYNTYVQTDDLCIPGIRGEVGTIECEIDSAENLVDKGDVSGAPIQVTSVTESRTSDGIRVRLDIENQGNGQITNTVCSKVTEVIDRNSNFVNVVVPGNWDCGSGKSTSVNVELRDGKGRLRCTKAGTGGTGSAYLDRFTATLTYNYVDTVSKSIVIQNEV